MRRLLIRGEGIAGSCCLRLLSDAGLQVTVEARRRPKPPAVMLGETTQKLLRDVFDREDLFTGFPRISRRVVLWGSLAEPVTLPHSAVVASEEALLERIQERLLRSEYAPGGAPYWTIFASSPLPSETVEHHFGSRPAVASAVTLNPQCDAEACWIESLEDGWLFLLPSGKGTGWLLSVGDAAESLVRTSRLITRQISNLTPSRGTFPAHPRVAFPLSAPGWLSCGTAALAFDPLCGDGAGNAVREAILASAAIRAAVEKGDTRSLAAHYQTRLLGGFKRHLALCLEFYKSGHPGPWWDRQVNDLKRGLSWCSEELGAGDASRYRLNGFVLERAE